MSSLLIFKPLFLIILLTSPFEFPNSVNKTKSNIFIPLNNSLFFIFTIGRFFPTDLSSKVFLAVNSESFAALAPCNNVVVSLASKILSSFIS